MIWFPSSLLLTIRCRFGWAACQLDTLRRSVPEDISKALNELPTAMDEKYMRTLEMIPKEKWERAHYLLQCLVASVRPLRVEELEEILALRVDRPGVALHKQKKEQRRRDSSFSARSSLIVEAEDSQILQFSHFSVEQFLTSTRLAEDGNLSCYHIPLEPAHTTLAEACLTVLCQDKVDDKRIGGSPLSTYAAQHWFIHTRFGNVATQPQVQPLVKDLFDANGPHFRGGFAYMIWTWRGNKPRAIPWIAYGSLP